jgi:cytochrome P450
VNAFGTDPYRAFERLRAEAPVWWSDRLRRFVVTRYAEVTAVLHDPDTFSSAVIPQVPAGDRAGLAGFVDWSARWLFFLDPPEHAARRAPVAQALAPRAVADLAAPVDRLARRLLAALPTTGFDLLADFAHPLSARVIALFLCTPGEDTDEFLARARALEHAGVHARDPAARRAGLAAMAQATEALRARVTAGPPLAPLPPMPAALRAAWGDDHDLVGAHSLVLLFAGVETTQNLIANAVHALLRRPARWAELRAERRLGRADLPKSASGQPRRSLLAGAVEEAARFDPPVLGVLRRATRDVTLASVRVPAGAELAVMVAAANRDPVRFTDPDEFDPRRAPNPHLAFGLGPHYCPGAALTRLTARVALGALLDAYQMMTITTDELAWRDHDPIVRGLTSLPVRPAVR